MNRTFNRIARYFIRKFDRTGLEQELNRITIDGKLSIPEISPLARSLAADGIVLLKNEHKTLPIRKDETVAVFGRCAVDYFTVGYGSGGDVVAPYKSSLMDGLSEHKVKLFEPLAEAYRKWCTSPSNVPDEGFWGHWPASYPEMPISREMVTEAAASSDLALVVIGRAAGEDRENKLKKGSFYLTDMERSLLEKVCAAFRRVAVILDCGNVIDMSWVEEFGDRIGAVLYAWQGGMESGFALADVLTGVVNPSGRLTDTIARHYEDYPSSKYFGGKRYNEYVEDIYVGYRFFETFARDKVLYPFGYGLSYTLFTVKSEASFNGQTVTVKATAANFGDFPGRYVFQVYLESPCGKLGKPCRVLTAFQKTKLLQPGQSQELNLSFNLEDFASFDDSGITGHPNCYILEQGTYRVAAGSDVRSAEVIFSFELPAPVVTQRLTEYAAADPGKPFDRMGNKNGNLALEPVPLAQKDLKAEILSRIPEQNVFSPGETFTFRDVFDGICSAARFVSQLTDAELDEISHGAGMMNYSHGPLGNAGAFGGVTKGLQERGLPAVITTDGPSGIRVKSTCSLLPCGTALASTFDPDAVLELYRTIGKEMIIKGSDMLLAPGMNIHRDPLCGRNFEYFSEDPYLTGKMAAAVIRGVQCNGVSACPKHFACNNQETNRHRNDSRVSQRALREIYLKGFEMAVKEAKPMAIMTSYNQINGVWAHYHYELVNGILRGEWGFDGLVITDWWMQPGSSREFPNIANDALRIRAGVDVLMPGQFKDRTIPHSLQDPNGIKRSEAEAVAENVVKFLLRLGSRKNT